MAHIVTAGYVTVETAVPGGRAHVDVPGGANLPADVPVEEVEALLRLGHITEADSPEVATDGDGVPEGSAKQVLDWVNADPEDVRDRAAMALDVEEAKGDNARKVLVANLQKLAQ